MSFWHCPDPQGDTALYEVAQVAGASHLKRVILLWLPEEQLCQEGFALPDSPGRTPVADLKDHHINVPELHTERFVRLAQWLQESCQDGHHRTINEKTALPTAVDGHTETPFAGQRTGISPVDCIAGQA